MGAWYFVRDRLLTTTRTINEKVLRPAYVGRRTMASPAEGYGDVHLREQSKILKTALGTEVSAFPFGCVAARRAAQRGARRAALLNVLLTPDPAHAPLQVHRGQRLPRGGVSTKQRADSAGSGTLRAATSSRLIFPQFDLINQRLRVPSRLRFRARSRALH